MRFAPTADWSSIAICISAIVLIVALLPIAFVMKYQWFAPRPFAGYYGMPHSILNPQPPYTSYRTLVDEIAPALNKDFDGNPWLPTDVPGRLGAVHELSATVMIGQERFDIGVIGNVSKLSSAIEQAYQWSATPNAVPLFSIEQQSMTRAEATDDVLTWRTARDYGFSAPIPIGMVMVDGKVAHVTYQHMGQTEDLQWAQGTWFIQVNGSTSGSGDVRGLAVKVARVLDRLTLPNGIGIARFFVDSPSDHGSLLWATPDGLMTVGSQIDPLVAIDVARSMAPMKKSTPRLRKNGFLSR